MQVPHDTLVVVADGRKMLLLRNEGNAERLNLQVERKELHESPRDHDQKSDLAGRTSSTQPASDGRGRMQLSPSGSSMEETDYHLLEEQKFAAEVARILERGALAQAFDRILVAAPARTLGELREHYHKEVAARLIGEIDKDLTNHPVPMIAKVLLDS